MVILLLFVLLYISPYVASDYQGDALYDMKTKLNASTNQLDDWNINQVNPCTWSSVICDGNNNVISVTLSSMGFTGTLSPRIGSLQFLQLLSLKDNRITGTIPTELGNLTSLTQLVLENNRLHGEIPASLGNLTRIQILILSQNNLSGNIPVSLSKLDNLSDFQLAFNDLSGQIPDELFEVAKYNFTGNNLNCGIKFSHPCVSKISVSDGTHTSKVGIIIGSVGGILVLSAAVILFLF